VLPTVSVPVSTTDVASVASALAATKPDVTLLLVPSARAAALAARLGSLGYTGTIASDHLYDPTNPAAAKGVTALTLVAPFEQDTAANRRMIEDVHAIKADQTLTPAVAAGYWSADLFVAILRAVGRKLTVGRFLRVANRDKFHHAVSGTVGPSTWPQMHERVVPCGALVQSDGTVYVLAEPYQCGATIRIPATGTGR
jgi:hypothetical protein